MICNGGTDTVLADTLDTISPSCENVQIAGHARRRRSTTARRRSPGPRPAPARASRANAPTTLSVNAADDRGVTKVQFFDDDRLLCEDTAAPYTCAYQPRGGDVGRNTLIAIAIDGANQTTSVVRAITVRRFPPKALSSAQPEPRPQAPYAFRASGSSPRPTPVSPSRAARARSRSPPSAARSRLDASA